MSINRDPPLPDLVPVGDWTPGVDGMAEMGPDCEKLTLDELPARGVAVADILFYGLEQSKYEQWKEEN